MVMQDRDARNLTMEFDKDGKIDTYLRGFVPARPSEMEDMESYADVNKFPIIGPAAGYFCYQIARLVGARKVFELGSGYGYSTAWFARAVQDNGGGVVHHVVWDEGLSQTARGHLERLGFGTIVKYTVGEAVQALRESEGSYDLIFNDIDKQGYPGSLEVIADKLEIGGVLITDNALWRGRVMERLDNDADTQAIREFTEMVTSDPDWIVSIVPIRDGLLVAYKQK